MPTRIGQSIARALQDGKISRTEAEEMAKTALENGTVSKNEAKELKALLAAHADQFEPAAKDRLNSLLGTTPLGPPPPGTPTTPVTPTPAKPTDIADPTVLKKDEGMVTYGKIDGGKLFVDGVSYDDVVQGSIANCYMVSGFSALAYANPQVIQDAIKDNGNGTFTVRFYERASYSGPMQPKYVTVDADLPTSGGATNRYAKARDGKELWVSLLEKAFAQWKGSYETIGNGGNSGDVMQALTGKYARYTSLQYTPADTVFQQIKDGAAQHKPMAAGTHGKDSGVDYTGTGVYAWHAYTVLGAVEENGEKFVQLRNPWGRVEHGSDGKDDGIFKMKLETFVKLYSGLTVGS